MKSARGIAIVALCLLGAVVSTGIYLLIPAGGAGGQVVGDLTPVGRFLVGSALGEDHARFWGCSIVQVITRQEALG